MPRFVKVNKIKIDIITDNNLIIPEYIIDLKNKSKKTIELIESFEMANNNTDLDDADVSVVSIEAGANDNHFDIKHELRSFTLNSDNFALDLEDESSQSEYMIVKVCMNCCMHSQSVAIKGQNHLHFTQVCFSSSFVSKS